MFVISFFALVFSSVRLEKYCSVASIEVDKLLNENVVMMKAGNCRVFPNLAHMQLSVAKPNQAEKAF